MHLQVGVHEVYCEAFFSAVGRDTLVPFAKVKSVANRESIKPLLVSITSLLVLGVLNQDLFEEG